MGTFDADVNRLDKELKKLDSLRGDEKAWKTQMKNVTKADDARRSHYYAGKRIS